MPATVETLRAGSIIRAIPTAKRSKRTTACSSTRCGISPRAKSSATTTNSFQQIAGLRRWKKSSPVSAAARTAAVPCSSRATNRSRQECRCAKLVRMSSRPEGDYVLGTGDEEVRRLQLQHTVWRPMMLDCWQRAGIGSGARVLDLGAGPGYAAFELAEIVGPTGEVVALERSQHFVEVLTNRIRERGLANIKVEQRDLATDDLPDGPF